jgi:hypothetical protein
MTTSPEILKGIAKAIKALDCNSWGNKSEQDNKALQIARAKMINTLFRNGYELQYETYRLIKSKEKRELLPETV